MIELWYDGDDEGLDLPEPTDEDYEIDFDAEFVRMVYDLPYDVSLVAILGYN